MTLLRLAVALAIGVFGTHLLPPETALGVLAGAIVIGIGPMRLLRLLVGLFVIMRAIVPD
jgi:hypothetical protein